jgi:hypothetical protein
MLPVISVANTEKRVTFTAPCSKFGRPRCYLLMYGPMLVNCEYSGMSLGYRFDEVLCSAKFCLASLSELNAGHKDKW